MYGRVTKYHGPESFRVLPRTDRYSYEPADGYSFVIGDLSLRVSMVALSVFGGM